MGARLVGWVLTEWTQLDHVAFRLLVRMAHTALDDPSIGTPAATFFGGRDLLASTMRSDGGDPQTVFRRVRAGLKTLAAAGAIERVGTAQPGENQAYRLTLGCPNRPVDNPF